MYNFVVRLFFKSLAGSFRIENPAAQLSVASIRFAIYTPINIGTYICICTLTHTCTCAYVCGHVDIHL